MAKAEIKTREVAWVGEKPIKWQSSVEYKVNSNRTIRIIGEPMSTKEQAMDSLVEELTYWEEAMAAFKKTVNNK